MGVVPGFSGGLLLEGNTINKLGLIKRGSLQITWIPSGLRIPGWHVLATNLRAGELLEPRKRGQEGPCRGWFCMLLGAYRRFCRGVTIPYLLRSPWAVGNTMQLWVAHVSPSAPALFVSMHRCGKVNATHTHTQMNRQASTQASNHTSKQPLFRLTRTADIPCQAGQPLPDVVFSACRVARAGIAEPVGRGWSAAFRSGRRSCVPFCEWLSHHLPSPSCFGGLEDSFLLGHFPVL